MPKFSLRRKPRKEETEQKPAEPKAQDPAKPELEPKAETKIEAKSTNNENKGKTEAEQKAEAKGGENKVQADAGQQKEAKVPAPKNELTYPFAEPVRQEKKSEKGKKKEKPKKEPKKAPLKIVKGTSSFVKKQTRIYLSLTAVCIVAFCLILVFLIYRLVFQFALDLYELIGLLTLIAPVALAYFFLHKYRIYRGGVEGEKEVIQQLKAKLDSNYTLINSLYLEDRGGDIDHIVLAPNGVFVLETKNWSGKISCNEDLWQRVGKKDMGSPSRQVKRNTAKVKRIIDSSPDLRSLDVYVEGIVVFTNKNATLEMRNPTVTVVKAQNLTNYITNLQNNRSYTKEQIDIIQKELLFNPNVTRVLRRNF
jgi:hypothetical protein